MCHPLGVPAAAHREVSFRSLPAADCCPASKLRSVLLFSLVAWLFSGCTFLSAKPLERSALLEADFGRVAAGEAVEKVFVVSNPTREPLGLAVRATSCRCAVDLAETAVVAGDSAEVRVRVETAELSGPVTRVVELATTDPQREILRLVLRGEVQAPVEADPAVLYFGRIARGSRPVRDIELRPAAGVRIRRVGSASGKLGLARATEQPEQGMRVRVAPPAGLARGGYEDRLVVEVQGARLSRFEVPVLLFVGD